jgi:predicted AAA+ superfamily ATPase
MKKKKLKKSQIFYINKEWSEFDDIQTHHDLQTAFKSANINTDKLFFVGLDEVQEIQDFEKFVLDISSKYSKAKIFITGSNSKLLTSQYATRFS